MNQRTENEIEHGKKLAMRGAEEIWNWSSNTGIERFSRRRQMLSASITENMNILEIGCGTGLLTRELAKTNARIIATDISPDLLQLAEQQTPPHPKLQFKLENAHETTFANETFNMIVGSSVLHHLDVDKALEEFIRILKPGGKIYFTEPNMLNPHIFLERHVPMLRKIFGVSPDETAFIRWGLKKNLLIHGFTDISITPFDFLHPATPPAIIPAIKKMGNLFEHLPFIREIAGSLYIHGGKPNHQIL